MKTIYRKLNIYDIKEVLDNLHRDFLVKEIKVDGITYKYPLIIHDEDCRQSIKPPDTATDSST